MSTLRSGESPDFSLVPLRHSLKGEPEGYLITARWEWKCRLPIVASNSTSLLTGRDESLSSLLGLLWHWSCEGVGVPRTVFQGCKPWLPTSLWWQAWRWGATDFGWSRAVIFYMFSALQNCSFPGPFTTKQTLGEWVGALYSLPLLVFLCCWLFSSKSGTYEVKRKPRDLTMGLNFPVRRPSLYLSDSYVSFTRF